MEFWKLYCSFLKALPDNVSLDDFVQNKEYYTQMFKAYKELPFDNDLNAVKARNLFLHLLISGENFIDLKELDKNICKQLIKADLLAKTFNQDFCRLHPNINFEFNKQAFSSTVPLFINLNQKSDLSRMRNDNKDRLETCITQYLYSMKIDEEDFGLYKNFIKLFYTQVITNDLLAEFSQPICQKIMTMNSTFAIIAGEKNESGKSGGDAFTGFKFTFEILKDKSVKVEFSLPEEHIIHFQVIEGSDFHTIGEIKNASIEATFEYAKDESGSYFRTRSYDLHYFVGNEKYSQSYQREQAPVINS